jgi:hypothetical protein
MTRTRSWTLTDVAGDVWVDTFEVQPTSLQLPTPHDWSLRKRTLRGGLREGVDLIEIHNGDLAISILPTRGMALWRGEYRGNFLGWRSPVLGPVHPRFVNISERGGLGWLAGFDELLCRCGLAFNGPPGEDVFSDAQGGTHKTPITLHGKVANLPAHTVEVRVGLDPPHELAVTGVVEECSLFGPQLRLTTTYTTVPGSKRLVIHDVVENRSAQVGEMQLLYHCNLGPPFLEPGSRVHAPIRELSPLTPRAAEGIDTFDTYTAPTVGFTEQVYVYDLLADSRGQTLALLANASADRAVALRFPKAELPCFTVWKNTAAVEDGYVTGLEPATNYPNFKTFERQQGRVCALPPGGRWEARWSLEVADDAQGVANLQAEIATLQAQAKAIIHREPTRGYAAGY